MSTSSTQPSTTPLRLISRSHTASLHGPHCFLITCSIPTSREAAFMMKKQCSSSLYPQGQTWHITNSQSTLLKSHKLLIQARKQPSLQNIYSFIHWLALKWPQPRQLCFRQLLFASAAESVWPLMSGSQWHHFYHLSDIRRNPCSSESALKMPAQCWPIVNISDSGSQASLHTAIIWRLWQILGVVVTMIVI